METRKRKPLSDLTNTYNLIPTSTLRKLVASASNSSSILKPPFSILKPNNPNSNQKLKVCPDSSNRLDSVSETSIGSSNVSALRDSRTVRFGTPKRANREITSPVRNSRNKDTAYIRREVIEKSNKSKETAAVIVSPTPLEKRKDKGKSIDAPSKIPNKENEICNSFGFSLEKTKDRKKVILKPSDFSISETKEIRKEILSTSSFLVERTKEKGKDLNVLSSLHEKARDKGKAVLNPSEIVEITKHQAANYPCTRKSEKRKNDAGASSCPPMMRNKNIQNDLDEAGDIKFSKSWTDPHPKCRKKRGSRNQNTGELPLDFIELQRAYYKEVDDFELPEEEISQDELD